MQVNPGPSFAYDEVPSPQVPYLQVPWTQAELSTTTLTPLIYPECLTKQTLVLIGVHATNIALREDVLMLC